MYTGVNKAYTPIFKGATMAMILVAKNQGNLMLVRTQQHPRLVIGVIQFI
ncbi:hypothetical protein N9970_00700 [bacterium]|jgi:hypothetical protein|nr:hypothetical protein [bacterium]